VTINVAVEGGSPVADTFTRSWIPEFEQKYPEIKVNIIGIPHEKMFEKFLAELVVAKTGAYDVINLDSTSLGTFCEGGGLEPLDGYLTSEVKEDYYPVTLESVSYEGKLYGMPYLTHNQVIYYRTDLFKEAGITAPPATWDELVDDAKKLTKNGVYGFVVEGKEHHVEVPTKFLDFLYANGGSIFENNDFSKVVVNSPAGVEALQFMVDLLHKYKVCPPGALGFDCTDVHTMFMQGVLAMAHNWPYQYSLCIDLKQSKVVGKFETALMPKKVRIAGGVYTWAWSISSSSRNKDAAWKWIEFAQSKEILKKLDTSVPGPIARKSVYDSIMDDPAVNEDLKKFILVISEMAGIYGIPAPPHPKYSELHTEHIGSAISAALALKKTPKEALDEAAEKIRALAP